MKTLHLVVLLSLLVTKVASAAPSVSGNIISWPNDGWYQVQTADDFTSICEGGQNCPVSAGIYNVINHTTGERFVGIEVGDPGNSNTSNNTNSTPPTISGDGTTPTVSGNTISWADNGWYQVQRADNFVSLCEGGRSCDVADGDYYVINHTTGERFVDITVPNISPSIDQDISAPPTTAENVETANFVELDTGSVAFTQEATVQLNGNVAAIGVSGYTELEGFREFNGAVFLFMRNADGQWTKTQTLTTNAVDELQFGSAMAMNEHTMAIYKLVEDAVPATGESRSFRGHVSLFVVNASGVWTEIQALSSALSGEKLAPQIGLDGDTMMIAAETELLVYKRNRFGFWIQAQAIKLGNVDLLCCSAGGTVSIDGDVAVVGAVRSYDGTQASALLEQPGKAFVLERGDDGLWSLTQTLERGGLTRLNSRITGYSTAIALAKNDPKLSKDTIVLGSTNNAAYVYTRNDNRDWQLSQLIKDSRRAAISAVIDNGRMLVGFPAADGLTAQSGLVEVYEQDNDGGWNLTNELYSASAVQGSEYGSVFTLDGDNALFFQLKLQESTGTQERKAVGLFLPLK